MFRAQIFIKSFIALNIIDGKGTASQNNVVLANAAMAIQTYYPSLQLATAIDLAKHSLFGLKAKESFNILKAIQ